MQEWKWEGMGFDSHRKNHKADSNAIFGTGITLSKIMPVSDRSHKPPGNWQLALQYIKKCKQRKIAKALGITRYQVAKFSHFSATRKTLHKKDIEKKTEKVRPLFGQAVETEMIEVIQQFIQRAYAARDQKHRIELEIDGSLPDGFAITYESQTVLE